MEELKATERETDRLTEKRRILRKSPGQPGGGLPKGSRSVGVRSDVHTGNVCSVEKWVGGKKGKYVGRPEMTAACARLVVAGGEH